jgi:GTP cyclohydrolase II
MLRQKFQAKMRFFFAQKLILSNVGKKDIKMLSKCVKAYDSCACL